MSGLIRPLTHRGPSSSRSKNRAPTAAINTKAASRGGGGIFCSRGSSINTRRYNGNSHFISSYEEDKRNKYRKQIKDRLKKWVGLGLILCVIFAVATKDKNKSGEPSLRATAESTPAPTPPVTPPPTPNPTPAPPPPLQVVTITSSASNDGKKSTLQKGSDTSVCGRPIPINLSDPSKWPTPFTPILKGDKTPEIKKDNKEITLVKNDGTYAGTGAQLGELFHVFDFSVEKGRPIYMTHDSWGFRVLSKLFFGDTATKLESNDQLWSEWQDTLGVKVIETVADIEKNKLEVPKDNPNASLLFWKVGTEFTVEQTRNHRDTILRKLFLYPYLDVCAGLETVFGKDKKKKYIVIHSSGGSKNYIGKFNGSFKKDQTEAMSMSPDYIKAILKQVGDKDHDIYLINGDGNDIAMEIHDGFANDNELKGKIKVLKAGLAEAYYLGTLADAYIGDPINQSMLWIARFRMALGLGKNTYVLTEKKGDKVESLLSQENYLDLYDRSKLGALWMA